MTSYVSLLFLLVIFTVSITTHGYTIRQKRVSDQRLAELETLVALQKLKGSMKSIPYGYGSADPAKLGRRRRSSAGGILLERLLRSLERLEESDTPPRYVPEELQAA